MKSIMNCKVEVQDKEKGIDTLPTNHARNIKREMEDEGDDLIPAWKKFKNFKKESEMEYDDERRARELELRELLYVNNVEEECNGHTRRLENEDGQVEDEDDPVEDVDSLVEDADSPVKDADSPVEDADGALQVEDNQAVQLPRLEDIVIGTDEEIGHQEEAEWIYEKAFSASGISTENLVRVTVMEKHVVPSGMDDVIEELPKVVSNALDKSTAEKFAEIDSIKDWLLYAKAYKKLTANMSILYEFGPVADSEEDWDADIASGNDKSVQIINYSEDWDAEIKAIEDQAIANSKPCNKSVQIIDSSEDWDVELKIIEEKATVDSMLMMKFTEESVMETKATEDWTAFLKSNREPVILPPFLKGKFVPIVEPSEDWDAELEAIKDEAEVNAELAVKSTSDVNANNKAFTDCNVTVKSEIVILPPVLKEKCAQLIDLSEDWDAELEENEEQIRVGFEPAKSCTLNRHDDIQVLDMDLVEEKSDTEIMFIEECSPKIIVTKVQSNEDPNAEVIVTEIVERCPDRRDGNRKRPDNLLMSVPPPTIKTEEFDEAAVNCEEEIRRHSMIFKIRKAISFIHNQQTELLPATLRCANHLDSELNDDELWKVYLWDERWCKEVGTT